MIDERYVAGFFDGEGCVHIDRNLRAVLAGCFRPGLLELIAERWGGSVTTSIRPVPNRRAIRRWEVVGTKASEFLRSILPHLIEKREQAALGIEYQELKRTLNIRGGKGYTQDQRVRFSGMETSLRKMKKLVHVYA